MSEPNNQIPADPEKPLNPDLVGYATPEELANAHRHLQAEAKRRSDENAQYKAQLDQLQRQVYTPEPRQEVKQRGSAKDRLTEFGVPVDAVQELIGEALQGAFQPILAGVNARQTLQARYPDYNKFESDVAQFIESDPETKRTYDNLFRADPAGAFEYAFLKFGDSRRRGPRSETPQGEAAHAAIPSSRNGEARREGYGAQSDTQKYWEEWQRTGSREAKDAYIRSRLKSVIPDSHFQ